MLQKYYILRKNHNAAEQCNIYKKNDLVFEEREPIFKEVYYQYFYFYLS